MSLETSEKGKNEKSDLFRIYEINKNSYSEWLYENKTQKYSEDIIKCLNELFKIKNISLNNIRSCIENTKYSKKYTIIAFRSFLNFCEIYELIELEFILKFRNKVKLNIKSNIDSYVPTKDDILRSLSIIKDKYPQFLELYKVMIESGCRFTELKDFIINFDKSKIEEWDDKIILYRNFYLRGKKSSFYLFFTKKTYENLNIKDLNNNLINSFQILSKRNNEIVTLKYLRKYNFTLMIENNISFEVANFIQGRTSQNIGFNHYLAKKTHAVKEYSKILNKFDF